MEKETVIKALHEKDARKRFNELLQLLIKHPHHPAGVVRFLNSSGYTADNLKMLEYDIKQCYGITAGDVRSFEPVQAPESKKIINLFEGLEEMSYAELKKLANETAANMEVELPDQKKETLLSFLNEINRTATVGTEHVSGAKVEKPNPYTEAPEEVKEGLKLRDEFPFLRDEDCPDEFKILVADKFTALEQFEAAHTEIQKLKETADPKTLFALAKKAVDNFELNREIYEELDYYKEHGEILGNHPIFADDILQRTVNAMSIQEAMKRQANLRSYISRESKKLDGIKDKQKKANAETKISDWQAELDLIDARLNATKE